MDELVVLFGGGGFLGTYIAQELLRSGARVRIAERNPLDSFHLKPLAALGQAQSVRADITKPETVARAVQGASTPPKGRRLPRAQMAELVDAPASGAGARKGVELSLIHISEPTRPY